MFERYDDTINIPLEIDKWTVLPLLNSSDSTVKPLWTVVPATFQALVNCAQTSFATFMDKWYPGQNLGAPL